MSTTPRSLQEGTRSKQFYLFFAMKTNFMNTNSTRFRKKFKQKMFPNRTTLCPNTKLQTPKLFKESETDRMGRHFRN